MKTRLLILIAILIFLAGSVFCAYYFYGVFTPFNSFAAQSDLSQGKVVIVRIGELRPNEELEEELANEYGFSYEGVGCLVSPSEVNGIKKYNQVMMAHLNEINGPDWMEKLEHEREQLGLGWTEE